MPKGRRGSSKKAPKKVTSKDFLKSRKKLGKKLKPDNATEVNFRAKGIRITKQMFSNDSKNLRLEVAILGSEITQQLTHLSNHKSKARREVLFELKKILSRAENDKQTMKSLLQQNLVNIISVFELIYDSDTSVRSALRVFINWLIPRCRNSMDLFGPFWNVILSHLNAALSHVNVNIRLDGIKILRIFFSIFGNIAQNYFPLQMSITLLQHCQMLFTDLIATGKLRFNNANDAKSKKNEKHLSMINILSECCAHILRALLREYVIVSSSETRENMFHSLLLPLSDDYNHFHTPSTTTSAQNNDLQKIQKSSLAIFDSCVFLMDQFSKSQQSSGGVNVLILCDLCAQCIHSINRPQLNTETKSIIAKCVPTLFAIFPLSQTAAFLADEDDDDDDGDTDASESDDDMDTTKEESPKVVKKDNNFDDLYYNNLRIIGITLHFKWIWKKDDYFKVMDWLFDVMNDINCGKVGKVSNNLVKNLLSVVSVIVGAGGHSTANKDKKLLHAMDLVLNQCKSDYRSMIVHSLS